MNKKIMWGLLIIFLGLFYMIQPHLADSTLKYIFNYQVILAIIGGIFAFQKKKIGWCIIGIAVYLYLKEFFEKKFDLGFPIVVLIGGIVLLAMGIDENRKLKNKKENVIYSSTMRANSAEVESAEVVDETKK